MTQRRSRFIDRQITLMKQKLVVKTPGIRGFFIELNCYSWFFLNGRKAFPGNLVKDLFCCRNERHTSSTGENYNIKATAYDCINLDPVTEPEIYFNRRRLCFHLTSAGSIVF